MLKRFFARFYTSPEDQKKIIEGLSNKQLGKMMLDSPDLALKIGAVEELIRRFEDKTSEGASPNPERFQ